MRWFNKLLQVWFSALSEGEDISDGWAHIWRKRSCFEYIWLNSLTNSLWFMTFYDLWENRQELGLKWIPKEKLWKEMKRFKLFGYRRGPNLRSRKMTDEWNFSIRSLFSGLRNTEKQTFTFNKAHNNSKFKDSKNFKFSFAKLISWYFILIIVFLGHNYIVAQIHASNAHPHAAKWVAVPEPLPAEGGRDQPSWKSYKPRREPSFSSSFPWNVLLWTLPLLLHFCPICHIRTDIHFQPGGVCVTDLPVFLGRSEQLYPGRTRLQLCGSGPVGWVGHVVVWGLT